MAAIHSQAPTTRVAGAASTRTHHLPHVHHAFNAHRMSLRTNRSATTTEVVAAQQAGRLVSAEVENTSWTSRKLFAGVAIQAPVQTVWQCLSDYEGLGNFIPSLIENKCLERRPNGAVLRQVGAQEVALGVNFSAACILDCTEYPRGVPEVLCSRDGDGNDGLLPFPRNSQQDAPSMDIAFKLIDGDFQAFRGIWRMQPDPSPLASTHDGAPGTLLCYSLYVQPKPWLPVGLIQSRIRKEVVRNLEAVKVHAERQHRQRMR